MDITVFLNNKSLVGNMQEDQMDTGKSVISQTGKGATNLRDERENIFGFDLRSLWNMIAVP